MSFTYQTSDDPEISGDEQSEVSVPIAPRPLYTLILIGAILAVSAVQVAVGFEPSIMAAGFDKPVFLAGHQYWRIFTGAATHGSILHAGMNCYAFYSFGRIFEMLSNRAHIAIVFLLSALGGGILSLIFAPDGISVGASGGIVGVIGYLAVYAFRRRRFVSPEFRKSLLTNIAFILVFGLVLFRVIDNYGHIGGLITGAVYGLVQIPSDEYTDPRDAGPVAEGIGLAALGIYVAVCCFSILLILNVV